MQHRFMLNTLYMGNIVGIDSIWHMLNYFTLGIFNNVADLAFKDPGGDIVVNTASRTRHRNVIDDLNVYSNVDGTNAQDIVFFVDGPMPVLFLVNAVPPVQLRHI